MIQNNTLKLDSSRLIYFVALVIVFLSNDLSAQNKEDKTEVPATKEINNVVVDTSHYKFGIRLGIDISGPIKILLNDDNVLLKGSFDARVYKEFFTSGEFGYQKEIYVSEGLSYTSEGVFGTIGGDYNLLTNKPGRNDLLAFGVRYGFATFTQTVDKYTIQNGYWNNETFVSSIPLQNSNAHWANFHFTLKVEVLRNFYIGGNVGFNFLFYDTELDNFDNLYIPGYGKNSDNSSFTFNYGISYLIPFTN